MPDATKRWVHNLPKVELHLHHVGATAPRTVCELAAKYPDAGVPTDLDELARFYEFTDFGHFLSVYKRVSKLLRTPQDVYELTSGNLQDLADQKVRYAEVTVTVNWPLRNGVPRQGFTEALDAARYNAGKAGLTVNWIIDIPGKPGESADLALSMCGDDAPEGLVALGLAGEAFEPVDYTEYFEIARARGLGAVVHAGESRGPESVRSALDDLHADRIGHGVRAMEDPELVARLRDEAVHLEVCPTSNVRTRVVNSVEDHPLPEMVAAGLNVSINSDDPPMFGTTLTNELMIASGLLGSDNIPGLLRNAIMASYADDHTKRAYVDELNLAVADHQRG
ncbi:hypothetical protein AZH51_10055 [Branchiibius sp. NY16-3462-2]|nr:hypothetical protein AZH51_10055 [Branchiibius sp. NY16-3462-2]